MNLRSAIFILVASAACLCATESKSNAQGGQLAARVVRSYAVRAIPGVRAIRIVRRGAQFAGVRSGGGQGFGAGAQQLGKQFGSRNGFQAGRFFRRR